MNWYKIVISQAIINTLREKGVDDDIIAYLSTIPNDIKGRLIYILTLFPHITSKQLLNIHANIYNSDPTVRKSYYTQILKWLQDNTIRLPEDSERIFNALSHYHNNKNNYANRNIQDYQRFQILEQEYRKLTNQISKREELRNLKHSGSKKIYEDERWVILDILTPEAASYYGKNTTWCTSGDSEECRQTAIRYIKNSGLYVILDKKNNEKYQATHDFKQVMDDRDENVILLFVNGPNRYEEIVTDLYKMLLKVFPEHPYLNYTYAEEIIGERFPQGEHAITQDLDLAIRYAKNVIGGRFPELEKIIYQDAEYSYIYAKEVIQGRFLQGEKSILEDIDIAFQYSKNVIKGRFPELEKIIYQYAKESFFYASIIIQGRFPEGEKAISESPYYSYLYAGNIIQGRFPEGEKSISQDAYYSYLYARDAIKGRFPEGEDSISTSSSLSFNYATEILKSRFPNGERAIFNDAIYRKQYIKEMRRLGIKT